MEIKQYIQQNTKDPVIVEAGSCEGYDTLEFSDMFPNGKIYSLEPVFSLYQSAQEKVKNRKNVFMYNMALAENTGEMDMVIADRFGVPWGSNSLLSPKLHLENNPDITFKNKTKVKTIKLDDFIEQQTINHIDLMWLDMQGYEPIVLMASPNSLKITKYIYSEINLIENYENNICYPEFKGFLEKNGYKVVFEDFLHNPKGEIDGGNVLFQNISL